MRELRDLRRPNLMAPTRCGPPRCYARRDLPPEFPTSLIDKPPVPARQIAVEVAGQPRFRRAHVCIRLSQSPRGDSRQRRARASGPALHALAKRRQVTMADVAAEPVVAHNDLAAASVLRPSSSTHSGSTWRSRCRPRRHQAGTELQLGGHAARLCAIRTRERPIVALPVSGVSRKRQHARVPQSAPLARGDAFLTVAQEKRLESAATEACAPGTPARSASPTLRSPAPALGGL